jgi:RNA polymerase sigma-70 factor, ECF subfamily
MTDNQEIADELARLYAIACGEWPDVSLELVDFVSYVTDRLPESRNASQLHTSDLYLACACSRGQTAALKLFERERAPIIKTALGQLRGLGADTDDVVQLVLQKVLVADDGPPKILDYNGTGELRGWLKAVAVRTGLNYLRARKREVLVDDDELWMALPVGGLAPGLAELRARYRSHFKEALPRAIAALSPQDRALLRYHYLDGLTFDQMAKIHGVHRSTSSRAVERACTQLVDHIRRAMRDALRVSDAELDSLVELVRSQLDFSLTGYFAAIPRLS